MSLHHPDVIVLGESHRETNAHKKQLEIIKNLVKENTKYNCLFLESSVDGNVKEIKEYLNNPDYPLSKVSENVCRKVHKMHGEVIGKRCDKYMGGIIPRYFKENFELAKKLKLKLYFVDSPYYPIIDDVIYNNPEEVTLKILRKWNQRDKDIAKHISTLIKKNKCSGGIFRVGWGHVMVGSKKHNLPSTMTMLKKFKVHAKSIIATSIEETVLPLAYMSKICKVDFKKNYYHLLPKPSPRSLDLPEHRNNWWDRQVRKFDLDLSEPRLHKMGVVLPI